MSDTDLVREGNRSLVTLQVTDVEEINGKDNWFEYPSSYVYPTGYSCLTPEGSQSNIKQYEVKFVNTDTLDTYVMYTLSHENERNGYTFELPKGFTPESLNNIPYPSETFCVELRAIILEHPVFDQKKQLRLLPNKYCCIPLENENDGCYCRFKDEDLPFSPVVSICYKK